MAAAALQPLITITDGRRGCHFAVAWTGRSRAPVGWCGERWMVVVGLSSVM